MDKQGKHYFLEVNPRIQVGDLSLTPASVTCRSNLWCMEASIQ